MKNVSSILEDNAGGFSSTRLAFLLWVVGALAVWMHASWKTAEIAALPESIVTILGVLMTGKAVQRFGEKPDTAASTTPTVIPPALPAAVPPNVT